MKNTTFVIEIHSAVIHQETHTDVQTIKEAQTIVGKRISTCQCKLGRWQEIDHPNSGNKKAMTAIIYHLTELGLIGSEIGQVWVYPPLPF